MKFYDEEQSDISIKNLAHLGLVAAMVKVLGLACKQLHLVTPPAFTLMGMKPFQKRLLELLESPFVHYYRMET